jgi:hypothetical protein
MPTTTRLLGALAILALQGAASCTDPKPSDATPGLAPTASALAPSKPAAAGAQKLAVDKAASRVDFVMEAPQEKILGHVPGTATGELQVDPTDVTRSTGQVSVDLASLEVVQAKMGTDGKFGPETKVPAQNEHARTWLEIDSSAPEKERAANSVVRFSIRSIEATGEKDLTKLTGAVRTVALKVTGDFLLHGRAAPKVAEVEASFRFDGDKLVSASFKTAKPFGVELAQHDVRPRDAFGKLALKTLEALAPNVAKEALVSLDFATKAP